MHLVLCNVSDGTGLLLKVGRKFKSNIALLFYSQKTPRHEVLLMNIVQVSLFLKNSVYYTQTHTHVYIRGRNTESGISNKITVKPT